MVSQAVPQQPGVAHVHPPVFGAPLLQLAYPGLHVYEHVVPLQVAAEALVSVQASPQALQLLVVFSCVHVPPHVASVHVQAPWTQLGVGCAHAPQLAPAVPHSVADCEP